ncbi:hypothetical protein [Sphingobacterium sp. B29]|uniref:hypothetical protein n=1 Tax=Sphingobacterium sp. B29 TaxID=1933220 RepID=UPI001C12C34C|nr:hypothetical protein [Sphingobacterium sp. B29]
MKKLQITFLIMLLVTITQGQDIIFKKQKFELKNVKASITTMNKEKVLKIERDLNLLPFDINNMSSTVDEPTYAKLKNFNFQNGVIEVKVMSRLLKNAPELSRGFIGLAFRIDNDDTKFESIYLRPTNGRDENQFRRNHSVQYFSYPTFKFDRLRKEYPETYETYADIGLNEWIQLRIEIKNKTAKLYINNQKYPSFIVNEMKGGLQNGAIGLWVDIGTEGYFKDLNITNL